MSRHSVNTYLLVNVKPEPFWMKFLYPANGRVIFKTIYLKREIFEDLQTEKPKPESLAVLVHEQTHADRTREIGLISFGLKYILSGKFRFSEELEANKNAFKILKQNKINVDLDRKAKILSGWIISGR